MRNATMLERKRLAKAANTTEGHLRQVSGGYRNGGAASTTPDLARQLEKAVYKLRREGLPTINRESLCIACGRCELAKIAREHLLENPELIA